MIIPTTFILYTQTPFSLPLVTGLQLLLFYWSQPGAAFGPSFTALGLGAWAQLEAKAGYTLCWDAQGTAISHQPLWNFFCRITSLLACSWCPPALAPWGQQKITVDCLAGQEGTCEEQLYIDITGRNPKDNPLGIPFTLIAESCLPGTYWPQVPLVTPAAHQHLNLLI